MPKLADLFVGILDFFAILLPGAIATAVLVAKMGPTSCLTFAHGLLIVPHDAVAAWAMFTVISYFLGHIIFMAGAFLDRPFHVWRALRFPRHSDTQAKADPRPKWKAFLASEISRTARRLLGSNKRDDLFACAEMTRNRWLREKREQEAVNAYQWARSVLIEKFPAAATDVQRLEADSKFFRSLVVLFLLLSAYLYRTGFHSDSLAAASLSCFCVMRYGSRRLKSERQAYIHVLTLDRLGLLAASQLKNEDKGRMDVHS